MDKHTVTPEPDTPLGSSSRSSLTETADAAVNAASPGPSGSQLTDHASLADSTDSTDSANPAGSATHAAPTSGGNWGHWAFAVTVAGLLLRVLLATSLDLSPDEAYYWELSRRLDLSYFDHPPMVAYLIAVAEWVFGKGKMAIRLFPLLGFAALSWLLFRLGRDGLARPDAGFGAVALLHTTVTGLALGFIMTPDVPLAFAWGLAVFAGVRMLQNDGLLWWLILGVALGFGALGKYNMIFLVPAVAITLLAFAELRSRILTGRFWLMVMLAFLGTVPILLWNHQHDWISFRFQFQHGFIPSNRSLLNNIGEFLGGQLGTFGLLLFPLVCFTSVKGVSDGWRQRNPVRFFIAVCPLPMLLFFCYTGASAKVEANWPQVAYLSALLLVAEWLCDSNSVWWKRAVIGVNLLLFGVVLLQTWLHILPVPPSHDITTRLHGWTQLGEALRRIDHDTGRSLCFVGQGAPVAALVGFYGDLPGDRVAEIHATGNWQFWWRNRSIATGASLIYVDLQDNSEAPIFAQYFTRGTTASLTVSVFDRVIRQISLTYLQGASRQLQFHAGAYRYPFPATPVVLEPVPLHSLVSADPAITDVTDIPSATDDTNATDVTGDAAITDDTSDTSDTADTDVTSDTADQNRMEPFEPAEIPQED